MKKTLFLAYLLPTVIGAACLLPAPAVAADGDAPKFANPFFAFCMDTHDAKKRTLDQQAEMLAELGYDGAGHLWPAGVKERLETLDAAGLELHQIYIRINLANADRPYDPQVKQVLPLLEGRPIMLAVLIQGMKPGDPAGTDRAIAILRELADAAKPTGTRIVIYHHLNDWTERFEQALRVANAVDRPNVGAMFNLCHWAKRGKTEDLEPLLKKAGPRLFAVSINGSDTAEQIQAGSNVWITSLDQGRFDQAGLLRTLGEIGYKGPIGLQCYGIGGDAAEHLARSMAAWKKIKQEAVAKP